MKTNVFYRTLKGIRKDERFEAILSSFPNSSAIMNYEIPLCDIAVIQGWKNAKTNKSHVAFRKEIIDRQLLNEKFVLTVDGNIFNYMSKNRFFRYSINGVFANTGYYFDRVIDPKRWEHIQKETECSLKPWRKSGNHILILAQKNSGWTTEETDNISWINKAVKDIRGFSDRPIRLRIHPNDNKFRSMYEERLRHLNIEISNNEYITNDLKDAWCSISYNSSPGAVSAIEGVPVFITDPTPQKSPAYEVGNINLERIENPYMPDREEWIRKISMSHFTIDDIKAGLLWNNTREYLERAVK